MNLHKLLFPTQAKHLELSYDLLNAVNTQRDQLTEELEKSKRETKTAYNTADLYLKQVNYAQDRIAELQALNNELRASK